MILAFFRRHTKAIALIFSVILYTETVMGAYMGVVRNTSAYGFAGGGPGSRTSLVAFRALGAATAGAVAKQRVQQHQPELILQSGTARFGGPSQPEMQQFTPVNSSDMVNLFTGDFSYNIPLMDVGGYPVNISYSSGITMDQEASWVGLGWNINPGTISRNMRGLPDDFKGGNDTVAKTMSTKENKTIGVTAGVADVEVFGAPLPLGASRGIFHNSYKGWGLENSYSVSINSGEKASGILSGGLTLNNNSQEGASISPYLAVRLFHYGKEEKGGYGTLSIGTSYSSRGGLSGLQTSVGLSQYLRKEKESAKKIQDPPPVELPDRNGGGEQNPQAPPPASAANSGGNVRTFKNYSLSSMFSSGLSFAYPSFMPSITMPYTGNQFSFTAKVGTEISGIHPSFYVTGYVSKQRITDEDKRLVLPAYGYLNYQYGKKDNRSLLDFNREKDMPYRDKPAVPHIGLPSYTYDVFNISGEGTGGTFRAYRGDIGYIRDNGMRTKDESNRFSLDVGAGNIFHAGVDINLNRSITETGDWSGSNHLGQVVEFRGPSGKFEAAYFRNPGEKAVNSKAFYHAIGDDDLLVPSLYQSSSSSSIIINNNRLRRYNKQELQGELLLDDQNVVKQERDKRSQVISYLTADEADKAALSKYIEVKPVNNFKLRTSCNNEFNEDGQFEAAGFRAEYFDNLDVKGEPKGTAIVPQIDRGYYANETPLPGSFDFSARFTTRIKAPITGSYRFGTYTDDGARVYLNDSLIIDDWVPHGAEWTIPSGYINLEEGKMYDLRMEYFDAGQQAVLSLRWEYGSVAFHPIPQKYCYPAVVPDHYDLPELTLEKRVNNIRKKNHISEMTVLNPDGRRYVYGIPVYNFYQKDVTFSVDKDRGNNTTGLAGYNHNTLTGDNSVKNSLGLDQYYSAEEMGAYAHSFLLTGIVSPDYVDVTGNGISDDDLGDAVKFNYSRTADRTSPYQWRAPYVNDSVTYNPGMRTDNRDDKGNYMYGKREVWYLNSIESKNMVAAFFLDNVTREDGREITENGQKLMNGKNKRLRKISLYNKADFLANDTSAIPVKTVYFDYTYELCKGFNGPGTNGKLTLKRIWFTYNGNEKIRKNPYVFNYHSNNPSYRINAYDRWGNYKAPENNPTTAGQLSNGDYPYVIQDSVLAADNASAWTLNEIKLPSGGVIKADYESDDYAYVQNRRSMQMMKLAGFGITPDPAAMSARLYTGNIDNMYAFIKAPVPVTSAAEVKEKYLDGINKLYFRLYMTMPGDKWGSGYEYVPCYAMLDEGNGAGYGVAGDYIWVKLRGVDDDGMPGGGISPLAKAAIQFLRLNLPSKAYPGSDVGDNIDLGDAVKILLTKVTNIIELLTSFDGRARSKGWANGVDLNRSLVRLTCPTYKRMGGGLRVKRITVFDNWNAMTQQKEATYGQEYQYVTTKEVNGAAVQISSGVACYEPGVGGEENPFHLPIEYVQQVAALAPTSLGYTEEPLGESYYPSPSVGYSKVRVHSIHSKNIRSAGGYQENCFYTAYDFPTRVERSIIDGDSKKRFKPALANFLKINARHFMTVSQGFKIELNDMHGKMRSIATYGENDLSSAVSYTENVYRVLDPNATQKELDNTILAMRADGKIEEELVGKDVELAMDMREQRTVINGLNLSPNTDMIQFFIPPIFLIPTLLNLFQREETLYRSVAAVKVIRRNGILDSVVNTDKGSRVTSKYLLYDGETGDPLLTRTQNLYNDAVYNFNYPAHWAYDGMGMAYTNTGAILGNLYMSKGRITKGLPNGTNVSTFFRGGDELLVAAKTTFFESCIKFIQNSYATFPEYTKLWAVNRNELNGLPPDIYFVDKYGQPFSGSDMVVKVIRSGRRNQSASIGSVATRQNPLVKNDNVYSIQLNETTEVLDAGVVHYDQLWKTSDRKMQGRTVSYTCPAGYTYSFEAAGCIKDTGMIATGSIMFDHGSDPEVYSSCGPYVYSVWDTANGYFRRSLLNGISTVWNSTASCGYVPDTIKAGHPALPPFSDGGIDDGGGGGWARMASSATVAKTYVDTTAAVSGKAARLAAAANPRYGALARSGIWTSSASPVQWGNDVWNTVQVPVSVPYPGIYYVGFGADNAIWLKMDSMVIRHDTTMEDVENFHLWHMVPVSLTKGVHQLSIGTYNVGSSEKAVGVEIYNNTLEELRAATSYDSLDVVFSTQRLIGRSVATSTGCPVGFSPLDSATCRRVVQPTDSLVTYSCYSALADTIINPYVWGVLGNFRADSGYKYYTKRKPSMAGTVNTNNGDIRKDGIFSDFAPFWQFVNNKLGINYNSNWVWTGTPTLFNGRGYELESKDPLNRYTAGLWGYNATLPVAVVQNSRYNEAAFEGFEDYNYKTTLCDTACAAGRHFDFSLAQASITSEEKHSGKYSLKVNSGQFVGVGANVSDMTTVKPEVTFTMGFPECIGTSGSLVNIRTNKTALLPVFSPIAGKKILFSAWVKEKRDCRCESYNGNEVLVGINTTTQNGNVVLHPAGTIIEGWQRYEGVIDLPQNTTQVNFNFKATGTSDVYFDDIRIHPFNGNMQSFVFHPVNQRLMATLDENNYATFYEYDDDGTLIRVKKETQRGIKTISETRSALRVNE